MSTFSVPLTTIREILPHGNADKLELAKVYDWTVVVHKGEYLPGESILYVPVDSLLPWDLEQRIFPPESKIKLHKSRIRSIRIRGVMSQGMILSIEDVSDILGLDTVRRMGMYEQNEDYSTHLGITKYEPLEASMPKHMQAKKKRATNPNFKKYSDIENFKYYDRCFEDGETVYVSEKLHGTSFRCGWFKNTPNTLWKKLLNFFGWLPEWEFCWGSRNVQIQNKLYHTGYYDVDVYTKIVKQYDLKNIIPKGYAIFGEIVGDGIQKGYTYGCGPGEHELYVYDVMKDEKYLDYDVTEDTVFKLELPVYDAIQYVSNGTPAYDPYADTFVALTLRMGLPVVPRLYTGAYRRELVDEMRWGDSLIGEQPVREGVVIRSVQEKSTSSLGRKIVKYINDLYYLKNEESGTDFH